MKNFKNLKIWQKGFEIAVQSIKYTKDFPPSEKFSLANQISRSAVSIPSNIAEGSSRNSKNDYHRFLEFSLESAFELETQLLIAKEVNFGNIEVCELLLKEIDEEQKMIMSFQKVIKP
jgi:four helix bundle protein